MASTDDPFTQVYNELWSMLEEDSRFEVKPGNKIKFNQPDRAPRFTDLSTVDYPQVTLIAENITGNLCNTSSTSMLIRRYSWVIAAGDFRVNQIFPLEWAIYAGMLAWRHRLTLLKHPDDNGDLFVKRANVTDTNFDLLERQREQRGLVGWISVWTIEVEMHFTTSRILGSHLP